MKWRPIKDKNGRKNRYAIESYCGKWRISCCYVFGEPGFLIYKFAKRTWQIKDRVYFDAQEAKKKAQQLSEGSSDE